MKFHIIFPASLKHNAGIVDKDIDSPPGRLDLLKHTLYLIHISHVRLKRHALCANAFQGFPGFFNGGCVNIVNTDFCPLPSHLKWNFPSETTPCA